MMHTCCSNRPPRRFEKGISLIALIITIIVIIILASIVIGGAVNTPESAGKAKFLGNLSQIKESVSIKRAQNLMQTAANPTGDRNYGFTKVMIKKTAESTAEDGWVVNLENINIKNSELGAGYTEVAENSEITLGTEAPDVYICDAAGELYYAKGFKSGEDIIYAQSYSIGKGEPANWELSTVTGTNIVLNDTFDDSAFVKIDGNSVQNTTTQSANMAELTSTSLYGIPSQNVLDSGYIIITRNQTTGYLDFTPKISNYVKSLIDPAKTYKIIIEVTENTFTNTGLNFSRTYSPFNSVGIDFGIGETGVKSVTTTIANTFNTANNYGYFILTNNPGASVVGQRIKFRYSLYELGSEPNPYVYNQFVSNSPNPHYPSASNSVDNFDLVIEDENGVKQTIDFPYTLRSLPNGTKDYIEIDNINRTAKLYQNVGAKVFNGTEGFIRWAEFSNNESDAFYYPDSTLLGTYGNQTFAEYGFSTHFIMGTVASLSVTENRFSLAPYSWPPYIGLKLRKEITGATASNTNSEIVTLIKSWFSAQYAAGTPVTVYYQLLAPVVTNLDYEEVVTYYPYTQIYTNATIQPNMEVTYKKPES